MIEERIGEVRLRVRTDLPDAASLRPAAERLVRAALERCAALLEKRAPGRVVLIRRLPLRWRFDETTFDEAAHVEELARTAADAIERMAVASSPASVSTLSTESAVADAAVLFEDEAHLRASHLLVLARGRSAWFDAALDDADARDPLAALAAPERREVAEATLARLARDGVLAEVLASHAAAAVAVLAAALGCSGRPIATHARESMPMSSESIATLAAVAASWPALTPPARTLALRVHASVLLDAALDAPAAAALADACGQLNPSEAVRDAAPALDVSARSDHTPSTHAEETSEPATPEPPIETATRCAGLFYLLDRIQELDLGESLWKACLSEGAVLASAMTALLGSRHQGDAAPLLFGGIKRSRCPKVTTAQHAEVAIATCAALAAALPRRGLADIPQVTVRLVDHASGRLMAAAAEGLPFAFFVWPAPQPRDAQAGLTAFLGAWPQRGRLDASPALVTLDTTGRLRPAIEAAPPALFLPDAPSAEAAALLAVAAGAPALLLSARAGADSLTLTDFVDRFLARPGRVRIAGQEMDVVLDAGDIDVDVRRAGLDRDPGWVPWLRRTVRFVFEQRTPPEGDAA